MSRVGTATSRTYSGKGVRQREGGEVRGRGDEVRGRGGEGRGEETAQWVRWGGGDVRGGE